MVFSSIYFSVHSVFIHSLKVFFLIFIVSIFSTQSFFSLIYFSLHSVLIFHSLFFSSVYISLHSVLIFRPTVLQPVLCFIHSVGFLFSYYLQSSVFFPSVCVWCLPLPPTHTFTSFWVSARCFHSPGFLSYVNFFVL